MHFRTRFVYFKSCRYNLCISRETYPYFYGDVAIIYAFSHEFCLFLMVVDIIYAFSHQICLFLRVVDIIYAISKHIHSYYYGDVAIIYALSRNITLITTEIQL